jgi:hypothetical protein
MLASKLPTVISVKYSNVPEADEIADVFNAACCPFW